MTHPDSAREWAGRFAARQPKESIAWTIALGALAIIGFLTVVHFLARLVP